MRFSGAVMCLLGLTGWASAAVINVRNTEVQGLEKRGPLAYAEPLELHPKRRLGLMKRDEMLEGLDPRGEDSFLYGDPDGASKTFSPLIN